MVSETRGDFRPPHGMGRKPDPIDRRDRILFAAVPNVDALPDRTNHESLLPKAQDQGAIGSCVGWSAQHVAYAIMKRDGHLKPYLASPVALYRWSREYDEAFDPGAVTRDGGTYIRHVWRAMQKKGLPAMSKWKPRYEARDLPDEASWEFGPQSRWRVEPTPGVVTHGETRQMLNYFRLPTLAEVLQSLADGYPAQTGFMVYRSFYDAYGPVVEVPMPGSGDYVLGGHAVTIYGYDKPSRMLLIRNQWGAVAHRGSPNFRMPFAFYEKHASDTWTGRTIEGFGKRKPVAA